MARMIWHESGPVAREAEARVLRTIVAILGVSAVAFFTLTISAIMAQSHYLTRSGASRRPPSSLACLPFWHW